MAPDDSFLIEHPRYLWLIWALPALCALFWACWRWNRIVLSRYFSPELLRKLADSAGTTRRWTKLAFLLLSMLFFIFALAEPKWGVSEQTVFSTGRDILILLDVSKSMLATDVAPSRLERVKLDIQDMVAALKGDRIGLVVFAGTPVLKCPLTTDYGFFRQSLERSGVRSVSRGGTFIGDAIRMGIDAFTDKIPNNKVMLLISDGEDQGSYPLEAARVAAERGIRIYTVGIGDREIGSRIQVDGEIVKDDGKDVWSKLNPEELRKIAMETGGAYIPAGTRSVELDRIYREKISSVERRELEETKKKYVESRYQLFLFVGILFLVIEVFLSDRRKAPAAGLALAFLMVASSAHAAGRETANSFDLYNLGRASYLNGDFDTATAFFSKAATGIGASRDLEADAFYNLGNTHVQLAARRKTADLSGAIQSLRVALAAYRESLDRLPGKADAQYNLELARRLLKQLLDEQKKKAQESKQKNDQQKKDQGDTGASQPQGDTSAGRQSQEQSNQNQGPEDRGKSFDRRQAEQDMKDRMKDMEELKQQLYRAARQKGVDPEKQQEQPAGVIVGGGFKDW